MEEEEVKGKPEVRERWMNLAPVKDFCVVREEGGAVVSGPLHVTVQLTRRSRIL